jgi:hypothetical protein
MSTVLRAIEFLTVCAWLRRFRKSHLVFAPEHAASYYDSATSKFNPISPDKFDPLTEWMWREGVPLTLSNWLKVAHWKRVRLPDLDAESIPSL